MLAMMLCLLQPIDFWGTRSRERAPAPLWSEGERPPAPVADLLERPTRENARRYLAWQKDRLDRLQAAAKLLEEMQAESAPILYFTRDGCAWCEKQDAVLKDLGLNVRRVTPDEPELWRRHRVTVTPTLIVPGREPLAGFRTRRQLEEVLK